MARAKTAAIARAQRAFASVSLSRPPTCARSFLLLRDTLTDEIFFFPLRCRLWTCPYCATIRRSELEYDLRSGHAERHIVLTLPAREDIPLADRVRFIRNAWRKLLKLIRAQWGPMQYAAILELQQNGSPHLHLLQRGCYISQQWLSKTWLSITGAWVVHIKAITRTKASIHEMTKYLAATAVDLCNAGYKGKIFTFSKGWHIDKPDRDPAYAERDWQMLWNPLPFTQLATALNVHALDLIPAGSFSLWKAIARPPPEDEAETTRLRIARRTLDGFLLSLAYTVANEPRNIRDFIDQEESLRHPEWMTSEELVSALESSRQPTESIDGDLPF